MGDIATENLREEFNRWAEAGRDEGMEQEHRRITESVVALMNLQPLDRMLDVGCGNGWLSRMVVPHVPQACVVGIDISDQMVRRAQVASAGWDRLTFLVGGVDQIPWESGFFTHAISVESAYYWPDPGQGMREILRVLAAGGTAWMLINYYRDNVHSHQWGPLLPPTHLLAADEWAELFHVAGFREVAQRRIPDPTPTPDVYTGRWFRDAEQLRKFRAEGALLVHGTKPESTAGN